jgi:hypothetical protein
MEIYIYIFIQVQQNYELYGWVVPTTTYIINQFKEGKEGDNDNILISPLQYQ